MDAWFCVIWTGCSSIFPKHPFRQKKTCSIHPFLQIILGLRDKCGIPSPTSSEDLCLPFCLILILWVYIGACSWPNLCRWQCRTGSGPCCCPGTGTWSRASPPPYPCSCRTCIRIRELIKQKIKKLRIFIFSLTILNNIRGLFSHWL